MAWRRRILRRYRGVYRALGFSSEDLRAVSEMILQGARNGRMDSDAVTRAVQSNPSGSLLRPETMSILHAETQELL